MSIQVLQDKLKRAKREDVGAVFVKTGELEAALAEYYDEVRAALEDKGYCMNCGRSLPGDGDCYGCAADKAWAEIAQLRAALEAVEWYVPDDEPADCPWCRNFIEDGHTPSCARQAALAPKERGESEVKHD